MSHFVHPFPLTKVSLGFTGLFGLPILQPAQGLAGENRSSLTTLLVGLKRYNS